MQNLVRFIADHPMKQIGTRLSTLDGKAIRFLLALLISPWAALLSVDILHGVNAASAQWPTAWLLIGALAAYGAQHFISLPALRALYRMQRLNTANAALVGFVGGSAIMALIWSMLDLALGIQVCDFHGFVKAGCAGMSMTLAFVAIAGIPAVQGHPTASVVAAGAN